MLILFLEVTPSTPLPEPAPDAWVRHCQAPFGCSHDFLRARHRSAGAAQCGTLESRCFGGFALCSAHRALVNSWEVAEPARQRPLVRYPRITPRIGASAHCQRAMKPKARRKDPFLTLPNLLFTSQRPVSISNNFIFGVRFRIYVATDQPGAWGPSGELARHRFIALRRAFNIVL